MDDLPNSPNFLPAKLSHYTVLSYECLLLNHHVLKIRIQIWSLILQAAFECMYTLMETCLDRLDVFEFLSHVEDGLKDHYDIKVCTRSSHDPYYDVMLPHQMLTFLLLIRLSKLRANALLQRE